LSIEYRKSGKIAWFFAAGCLLFATVSNTLADGDLPTESLYYVDSRDGLPQNSVRGIVVDENNFVWVGTERGLARFDGHRFIDFSERDERIPVDVLLSMYRDGQDRIWLNWYKNDPQVLIPATNRIINVHPARDTHEELRQKLWRVFEDSRGRAWFAGTNHVYWMDADGSYQFFELPAIRTMVTDGVNDIFYVGLLDGLAAIDVSGEYPDLTVLPWGTRAEISGHRPPLTTTGVLPWRDQAVICTSRGIYLVKGIPDALPPPLHAPRNAEIADCRILGDTLLINEWQADRFVIKLTSFDLASRAPVENPAGLPGEGRLADVYTDSHDNQWVVMGDALYVKQTGHRNIRIPPIRYRDTQW
jgi:hypothetical protein